MQNGTLSLVRGDDQNVGLTITQPDGSAYNLSGCSLIFTAREGTNYFSPVVLSKTVTGHIDNSAGTTQIVFATGDTAVLDAQEKFFDIKLLNVSGKYTTLIYGALYITPR